jgi:hypothetical protein
VKACTSVKAGGQNLDHNESGLTGRTDVKAGCDINTVHHRLERSEDAKARPTAGILRALTWLVSGRGALVSR